MIFPSHSSSSHPSSVPPFHSLVNGTVEQTLNQRNSPRNINGTFSLKALANKVFERNTKRNNPGTDISKSVPLPDQTVPLRGTNAGSDDATQYDALSYEFEERVAIAEYDGQQTPQQAQRIAYLDAFLSMLFDISELDSERDWLAQRVQAALNNLEAQHFPTQH